MAQVEKLKIFLASPGDVSTERRYVVEVVEEVNRTVAGHQGVVLEVVRSEKNLFPGYGKDGQAIVNEQIAQMREYALFVGVMWNRIGTPTPRAKSGTVEEFGRAVTALRRGGKPQVWFYFRQWPANLTTTEELQQRADVLEFRKKFQRGNGLYRDYKTPADFKNQFREQLIFWLNQRTQKAPKPRATAKKQTQNSPKTEAKAQLAFVGDRSKTTSAAATAITTPNKTSRTPRKTATSKRSASQSARTVTTPSKWVMLNEKFFQAESNVTQVDQSIVLRVVGKDLGQTAELRSLYSGEVHSRKQIAYADQHHAGVMQVSSLEFEALASKTRFEIKLAPDKRSQNNSFVMEPGYNSHTADEIAELRARRLLLNEVLPKDLGCFFPIQITNAYGHRVTIENSIFPELWVKLQSQSQSFLPKAWLWAVYHLKQSQLVEDVLALELGSIENKVMPVRFRGRRRQSYVNQEPFMIEVVGNCPLSV